MSRLTVLLAPRRGVEDVRSTLHDWVVAGLVSDFLWVEPQWVGEADSRALQITAQGQAGTTLRTTLADAKDVDEVQLCVIVPLSDSHEPVPGEIEQRVLSQVGGNHSPLRVRIAYPSGTVTGTRAVVAREFWHNLVVVPEDREGPAGEPVPFDRTTGAAYGMHVTANVAGALGLWTKIDAGAVSGAPQPGETARLTASYFRRLSATASEDALRRSVLSTDAGLPRPRRHGSSTVYIDDANSAALTMAQRLWDRHRALFESPRQRPQAVASKAIGAREALAMFFTYMWAAIRNAPRAWLERFKTGLATTAAGTLQRMVFGTTGSAYEIVVNGVTRDGRPASLLDINRAAQELERAGDDPPARAEGTADFSALWRDFCNGALTLADGGERDAGMAPIQIGPDIGVMRSADLVAPGEAAAFGGLSGQLGAAVPVSRVPAYDIHTITSVEQQLARLRNEPDFERETAHAVQALRTWRARTEGAYTARVGLAMSLRMQAVQQEIAGIGELLKTAGEADLATQEERQKSLARRLRLMLLGVVLAIAAAVAMVVLNVVGLLIGAIIGVVVLVGGFLAMVRTFWVSQRDLFQMLHRREQAAKELEAARHNVIQAARDIRRLTDAYPQFLAWSRVLGGFHTAPFGTAPDLEADSVDLQPPLPRSMKIGTVEPTPEALARLADDIRREVFVVGWLSAPWQSLIDGAAARVGPGLADAPEAPNAIYSRGAGVPSGVPTFLDVWSESVARDGAGLDGAQGQWQGLAAALGGSDATSSQALMSTITTLGRPDAGDLNSFLSGVDGTRPATSRWLHAGLLHATASSADVSHVDDSIPRSSSEPGLSRVEVLIDLSKPIRAGDFALSNGASGPAETADFVPPPMPAFGSDVADQPVSGPPPAQPRFAPPPLATQPSTASTQHDPFADPPSTQHG